MGSFYVNFTLKGPGQDAVVKALSGRAAYVSREEEGCVVVYDEASESQDPKVITKLASELSRRLGCPLLAVVNHDDDVLQYQLFINGKVHDSYESDPSYFGDTDEDADHDDDTSDDEDEDEDDDDEENEDAETAVKPEGGDPALLCRAFGSKKVADVTEILGLGDEAPEYAAEIDRHLDLVKALGLPDFAVGYGYEYIAGGEMPDGLGADDLAETS